MSCPPVARLRHVNDHPSLYPGNGFKSSVCSRLLVAARHAAGRMSIQSLEDDVVDEVDDVDDEVVDDDPDDPDESDDEVDELVVLEVDELVLLAEPPRLSFL
jgi:hypothetical protein